MLSIDKINKLEKENAELKAENERLKLSERDLSRICQGFKKDIETEKTYALKYYTTLQEIKEIVEDAYENEGEYQATGVYSEILQKIAKAEEE